MNLCICKAMQCTNIDLTYVRAQRNVCSGRLLYLADCTICEGFGYDRRLRDKERSLKEISATEGEVRVG